MVGVAGIPSLEKAGNVLRTSTTLKLSVRVPPRVSGPVAAAALKGKGNFKKISHVTSCIGKRSTLWS